MRVRTGSLDIRDQPAALLARRHGLCEYVSLEIWTLNPRSARYSRFKSSIPEKPDPRTSPRYQLPRTRGTSAILPSAEFDYTMDYGVRHSLARSAQNTDCRCTRLDLRTKDHSVPKKYASVGDQSRYGVDRRQTKDEIRIRCPRKCLQG
jgi:hypothetical protein